MSNPRYVPTSIDATWRDRPASSVLVLDWNQFRSIAEIENSGATWDAYWFGVATTSIATYLGSFNTREEARVAVDSTRSRQVISL